MNRTGFERAIANMGHGAQRMDDKQRRAMFAKMGRGNGVGQSRTRSTSTAVVSSLGQADPRLDRNPNFAPMHGNGAVKAPPNDGYSHRYDIATQSWVRGPSLESVADALKRQNETASLIRDIGISKGDVSVQPVRPTDQTASISKRPLIGSDPITWSPKKEYSSNEGLQKIFELYRRPTNGSRLSARPKR